MSFPPAPRVPLPGFPEMGRGLVERHCPREAPHLCSFGEGAVSHQDLFSGQQLLPADLETQPHSSLTTAQPGLAGARPEAATVACPWGSDSQSPAPPAWRPEGLGPRACLLPPCQESRQPRGPLPPHPAHPLPRTQPDRPERPGNSATLGSIVRAGQSLVAQKNPSPSARLITNKLY